MGGRAVGAVTPEDEFAVFALKRRLRRRAIPAAAEDSAGAEADGFVPVAVAGGGTCEVELSPAFPVANPAPGRAKAPVGIPDAASAASIPDSREPPMPPSRPETRGRK